MVYKLLALDLDDTLLDRSFQISPQNMAAIQSAVQKGVLVTFATGRMYCSALPYARQLGIEMPLITYHGALIKTVAGETLYHCPVPLDLAREIIAIAKAGHYNLHIYLNDELYVAAENEHTRYYQQVAQVKVNAVGDLVSFLTQAPTKLTIVDAEERLPALQEELRKHFNQQLAINISRSRFLEITAKQATKGQALRYLAKLHQIPRSQIAAIGDSYNDLDMLEYAGMGVAVANAREAVKEVADHITEASYNHGVAVFIQQYVLRDEGAGPEWK